jgi:hypothetical protein
MSKKQTESKQADMSAEKSSVQKETRRKVLRNTLIGGAVISTGALPEKWSKPVLDSVILPVHAETTDDSDSNPGGNPTTTAAPTTTPVATTTPKKLLGVNVNYDDLDYDIV